MTSYVPVFVDFAGRWSLRRQIEDRLGDVEGEFLGEALFDYAGGALRYHETGFLRYGDAPPLHAERDYLWRPVAGRIAVDYGDGRPFHDFDPANPLAEHFCAPDHYAVRYNFERWPMWQAEWDVVGPRKDYRLVSSYAPTAGAV
jgi:hypothetical protein